MSEVTRKDLPKGFVVFYTNTHSVCLSIDTITAISKGVLGSSLQIQTTDGSVYAVDYSFDDFLTLLTEAQEEK